MGIELILFSFEMSTDTIHGFPKRYIPPSK